MKTTYAQSKYPIQSNCIYFDAGRITDKSLVVMGPMLPNIAMAVFDQAGKFIGTKLLHIDPSITFDSEQLNAALCSWQMKLGFIPETISVEGFFDEDNWIGIRDLPEHYQEVIDHPERFESERMAELQQDIRDWMSRGNFVFFWTEDYYLNSLGEVESS